MGVCIGSVWPQESLRSVYFGNMMTGNKVIRAYLFPFWFFYMTLHCGFRTSRGKWAADGELYRAWYLSRNHGFIARSF